MIWSHLGQERLQRAIGGELLARLEPVLRALDPRGDVDLYSRRVIARVFDAFVGVSCLRNDELRTALLGSLPPPTLSSVAQGMGIKSTGTTPVELAQALASVKWTDQRNLSLFAKAVGLPLTLADAPSEEFPPVQRAPVSPVPYRVLQDYQWRVFSEAKTRLDTPRGRFLIQMPTGSGKTRTAMELVCYALDHLLATARGGSIVWIAHSEELCSQAMECFLEVWVHVGKSSVPCYRLWGTGGRLPLESQPCFVVGSFQKLYSELQRNQQVFRSYSRDVSLVVVDEAHKVTAPTYRELTSELLAGGGHLVGLTATPGRSALDTGANQELASFFHSEIVKLEDPSGGSPIAMLRRHGMLSRLECYPLVSRSRFTLSASEKQFLESNLDLPPGLLRRIGDDDVRNVEIVGRLREECAQSRQILFFACSVDHSRFICALLTYFGIRAAHIDGRTDAARRVGYIAAFKNKDIQVLCNFGILTTGFDAPKTDVVFISRPTNSVVLYSQMIGRGLRGPKLGGTGTCRLVDVRDNIEGLVGQADLYQYFDEYWS